MFRPDSGFLDFPELAEVFRSELKELIDQAPYEWNPHDKLEYTKVSIRTLLGVHSKKYLNSLNSKLNDIRIELDKLIKFKQSLLMPSTNKHNLTVISLEDLNYDIDKLQSKFDSALADRSKYLSKRARVKWLEQGEKSNKYFLNLIHRNSFNMYLNELYDPETCSFTKDNELKLKIAHNFYAELYSLKAVDDPKNFLAGIGVPNTDDVLWKPVSENLTYDDITKAIKKCGNTASGPDGIGYNVLKHIWDIYVDNPNYANTNKPYHLS